MNNKDVIVVFGGAFNPPLNSHFSLAEQIINEYEEVAKVIFVPVNSKYNKEELLSNEHRYNMLKLACDENEEFEVSSIEIDSLEPLYTIETLEILEKSLNNYMIWFTIGSDNLKTFNTWKKKEELVSRFKILVLERDNDNMDDIIDQDEFLRTHKQAFIKVKNNIKSNLSSTFVRDKIKRKKSIRYLTTDEIYYYIKENKLFE